MKNIQRTIVYLLVLSLLSTPVLAQKGKKRRPAVKTQTQLRQSYDVPGDVQFGESTVIVRQSNVTYKLAIAPGGIVAVEFPAEDAVASDHSGNSDVVMLDGKEGDENTRRRPTDALIFRPGPQFPTTPPKSIKTPVSMISIQMASGLFVTFLFYYVSDLSRNAVKVTLQYKMDEIRAARATAGLRTNLIADLKPRVVKDAERLIAQEKGQIPSSSSTPNTSVATNSEPQPTTTNQPASGGSVNDTPKANFPSNSPDPKPVTFQNTVERNDDRIEPTPPLPLPVDPSIRTPTPVRDVADVPVASSPKRKGVEEELWMRCWRVLNEVKSTSKPIFGRSLHGLAVTPLRVDEVDAQTRIVVFAVKNTLGEPIRITPGQPELFIETLDKGKTVQSEHLARLYSFSTLEPDALFEPGTVEFFVLAYHPPILGVQQTLRIGISQTNAADDPAGVNLTVKGR